MSSDLLALASEVLQRLEGHPPSPGLPRFLAANGIACLLQGEGGVVEVPRDALPSRLELGHLLDHTLLKPTAQMGEIEQLCREAREYRFASVCINPAWVKHSSESLAGSPVAVCTVVGFPLGANTLATKCREAEEALAQGAREIDFVLSLGLAKAGAWAEVAKEFRELRRATAPACLKVILETCLLEDKEKRMACHLAREEGLDFVKTSTGFSTGGATPEDVALMRDAVGATCGVKASGGIRTYDSALAMLLHGATRLGVSASLALIGTPSESRY